MTLAEMTDPTIAPIVAAVLSIIFTLNMAFARWLVKNFSDLRNEIRQVNERIVNWLDLHENEDQRRHEDNLRRFEQISVALAKLEK
jgi:hypothetical protein